MTQNLSISFILMFAHREKPQMGCVCPSSPPLPALLIRQVTTVRVLDAGQQRSSRWQVEPETLAPALCCLLVLKLLLPLAC